MAAQVASVDNARETVDQDGEIDGTLASETLSGRLDAGLDKVSGEHGGFASSSVLNGA